MITFFDCETTGKADMRASLLAPHQPRIVQLAALLCDETGKELQSMNFIIKPDGYEIPVEASAIHGITTELATKVGVSIKCAINAFWWFCNVSQTHVAHNVEFDFFMCQGEFLRAFNDDLVLNPFCTMKAMTDVRKLPGPYGNKWPKLIEAHQHAFGCGFEGAHDALADVRACAKIYFWLMAQQNQKTLSI